MDILKLIDSYLLSEAGQAPGKMELVKTSLKDARAYAEDVFRENGFDLDTEIPDFDKNYATAQKLAGSGRTLRKDMPVIESEQVKQFQKRLENGRIDHAKPFTKEHMKGNPFPEGLKGQQAKDWMKDGLMDGDKDDDNVKVSKMTAKVKDLKPIQKQIYFDKSISACAQFGTKGTTSFIQGKSIMIASSDNYIIDGHHRFLSAMLIDPNMKMNGVAIDLPIKKLLPLTIAYGDASGNKRNL